MADKAIIAEIWEALRSGVTFWGDTCFASNRAMEELERHGQKLLPAIEAVLNSQELEQVRQTDYWTDLNLGHLLLMYFEQADTHRWDSADFLKTLRVSLRHEALVAIYQIWGPLRQRKVMPAKLYEIWQEFLLQDPEWIGDRDGLSGFIADGSLILTIQVTR